jgi:hypothetical protein
MFKILVDGMFCRSYPQTFRGCITVGSAADAHVRLDRDAPLCLQIRPLTGGDEGDFAVTVHDPAGMTHNTWSSSGIRPHRQYVHYKKSDPRGWLGGWLDWTTTNAYGLKTDALVTIWGDKPPGWVRLRGGDAQESMTFCGHKIEVITGCWTCGRESSQMWACTCADRRT